MTWAAAAAPSRTTRRSPRPGRLLGTVALLVVAVAGLLLAAWQVQRLHWKQGLLARVATLPQARAEALPDPATWPTLARATDEYRLLQLQGHWLNGSTQTVRASTELGRGHWVLTPLALPDGRLLWVNRGFVDDAHRDAERHAAPPDLGASPRSGLLRMAERSALPFLAPVLRDPLQLSAAGGLRADRTAPFFVDLTAEAGGPPWPRAGLTVLQFRNHHLVYAFTWAALAVGAALAAALWWRRGAD